MTVKKLCCEVGISRQGFYKGYRFYQKRRFDELKVIGLVKRERLKHPRLGGRKLYAKLKRLLTFEGVEIGRDRFFDVLGRHDLLIKRRRSYCRTTNSSHGFRVYKNLVKDKWISRPHEVWVSDLTYIDTIEGFLYLSLITDSYSRKIVGYEVSDTLESIGCERALDMALKQLPFGEQPIHHSDRGIQYCSNGYTNKLRKRELPISMTEENHCYENAQAERVNGILKDEYYLGEKFSSKAIAKKACRQAVNLYNSDRPHLCLDMKTPEMVHLGLKKTNPMEFN